MLQILFALAAGVLTIAAPCILPMLPIILGASVGQNSRKRPLFITLGFVLSFSAAALFLSFLVSRFGFSADTLRQVAVVGLILFGTLMVFKTLWEKITSRLSGLVTSAQGAAVAGGSGNRGGFVLGLLLGVVWTPCAGPILGSILTLIAAQGDLAGGAPLLIAYSIGAGIPMLAISYGGQFVTTKVRFLSNYAGRLQQIFGVIIIAIGVLMFLRVDTLVQAKLVEKFNFGDLEQRLLPKPALMPNAPAGTPAVSAGQMQPTDSNMKKTFPDLGVAPDFAGIEHWINSGPLTMQQLKGKVVLIDFWTYSCINCIRTLPYVTSWYEKYKDQGLVIVGVHTPEFEFEKKTSNVETAMRRYKINYPVAQDNTFSTWNAYKNQYWPAHYLVDRDGHIRETHFGEGNYEETEAAIVDLLGTKAVTSEPTTEKMGDVNSPEMYFGTSRLQYLAPSQMRELTKTLNASADTMTFAETEKPKLNEISLTGTWQFSEEKAQCRSTTCAIHLPFSAGKLHMVAQSKPAASVSVTVDGKSQPPVSILESMLYTLFDSTDYRTHDAVITVPQGFDAFTFTFG